MQAISGKDLEFTRRSLDERGMQASAPGSAECPRCGLRSQHANADQCIGELRDRIAILQFHTEARAADTRTDKNKECEF